MTGPSWDTIHLVTEPSLPLAMHLTEHSLHQLDEAYLRSLDLEALRYLSARLLADLKEARARLDAPTAGRSRSPQRPAPSEYARNRAALADFIETCRQRGQGPWRALERAIADRRAGTTLPTMASVGGVNSYSGTSGRRPRPVAGCLGMVYVFTMVPPCREGACLCWADSAWCHIL